MSAVTGLDDPVGADAVASELGDLPLALATAAAAIAASGMTYARFLQRVRSQALPRALRQRVGQEHRLRVDQAITFSLDEARSPTGDRELDTTVQWLLGLFAVLDSAGIGRELLTHPDPVLNEWVDDAIDHCVQRSLLIWSTGRDSLLAHRLTARVLREQVLDSDHVDTILAAAVDVLQSHLFDGDQAWHRQVEGARLVDHIDALTASGLPARADQSLRARILEVRRWATRQLTKAADFTRAIELAQNTLSEHEHVLGLDHPHTLDSRHNLAHAYREAGRIGEAIALHERTLTDSERVLGLDHPDTLTSRHHLAYAYHGAGRIGEAIALYERTLTDSERLLGPDHPHTLTSRHNFAWVRGCSAIDRDVPLRCRGAEKL